jgi:hypothetical protein
MICAELLPDNVLKAVTSSAETCAGYVALDPAEYLSLVSSFTPTPEEILFVFSWGFGTVVFFWFLGASIGAGKKGINKA